MTTSPKRSLAFSHPASRSSYGAYCTFTDLTCLPAGARLPVVLAFHGRGDNVRKIGDLPFRREVARIPVGHAASALVETHHAEVVGEEMDPVAPERAFPLVIQMRRPVRRLDQGPPLAGQRVGDPDTVGRNAEADLLRAADGGGRSLEGIRVLVVEDEADARDIVRIILEQQGADVVTTGAVPEAFRALESWLPDVIVSDIGLPGEDGYDLIARLRARDPAAGGKLPAIALTAYARAQDRANLLAAGGIAVDVAGATDGVDAVLEAQLDVPHGSQALLSADVAVDHGADTLLGSAGEASHGVEARPRQLIAKVAHILKWMERYRTDKKEK